MTRVCWFGAYDPAYPRNRILRSGLARRGIEVVEARVPEHRAFRRYPALLAAITRSGLDADVFVVPEFRHKDVPLARAIAGSRPLVFDPLVSRHDTLVGDWGLHREGSFQARWNRALDRWTLALADRVLCDTWAHGALFASLGVPRARLRRIVVGAEDGFFAVPDPDPAGPVRIVYVGGFLPLHGVPLVIEALARLERARGRLPAYEVELIGKGIELEATRTLHARSGIRGLTFPGPIAYAELPRVLARADIVLGAFGPTEKAARVVPHKVYQGLAAGRAVVTADTPGIRELFEPGRDLAATPRGDAEALSATLAELIADPQRRRAFGAHGRARCRAIGTPDVIGAELARVLAGGGDEMP